MTEIPFHSGPPQSPSCSGVLILSPSPPPVECDAVCVVLAGLPPHFGPSSIVSILASFVADGSVSHIRLLAAITSAATHAVVLCASLAAGHAIIEQFDGQPVSAIDPELSLIHI